MIYQTRTLAQYVCALAQTLVYTNNSVVEEFDYTLGVHLN